MFVFCFRLQQTKEVCHFHLPCAENKQKLLFSVSFIFRSQNSGNVETWTWRHGEGNMETWKHGNMETWKRGDVKTQRHGHGDIKWKMGNRSPGDFP
jgi:hypothetical protein